MRFSLRYPLTPTCTPTPEYHPPPSPPITNALGVPFKHLCAVHVLLAAVATYRHIRAHRFPGNPPGGMSSTSSHRRLAHLVLCFSPGSSLARLPQKHQVRAYFFNASSKLIYTFVTGDSRPLPASSPLLLSASTATPPPTTHRLAPHACSIFGGLGAPPECTPTHQT
ncbi:hypothetical protein B0H19DRAFT_1386755 [Mycena capillaripes]|nr:hypothetical protein B0H19DRAFT_1386755 [Mycena capillaripes]